MKATLNVNDRSLAQTTKKLERAIEREQHNAVGDTLDEAIEEGQERIRNRDAIWKWQTYDSFKWGNYGSQYHILNTASYAGAVDKGADFEDHPPADDLVPWVLDNLQDWHPVQEEARERLNLSPDEPLDPSGDDDDPSGDSSSSYTDYGGDDASGDSAGGGWTPEDGSPEGGSSTSGGGIGWGDVAEVDSHDGPDEDANGFDMDSVPYSFRPLQGGQELRDLGKPTAVSGGIADNVDYTDVTEVTTGTFDSDFKYKVLSPEQEGTLLDYLRFEYDDPTVDTLVTDIQKWKEAAFSTEGAHLESIAKARYDIDAPVRGEDQFDIPEVTPEQQQAFHELSVSSQEILSRNHATAGKLQVYRGLRSNQITGFSKSIIEKPRADSWSVEDTVIQNFTLDTDIAEQFSEGIEVATTVDLENETLFAPDFVLDDNHDGLRNSEVWVVGGEHGFAADTLTISGHRADQLMKKPPWQYDVDELEAIELLVNLMYEDGTKIETDAGQSWLREWLRAYEDEFGDSPEMEDKIEEIIL